MMPPLQQFNPVMNNLSPNTFSPNTPMPTAPFNAPVAFSAGIEGADQVRFGATEAPKETEDADKPDKGKKAKDPQKVAQTWKTIGMVSTFAGGAVAAIGGLMTASIIGGVIGVPLLIGGAAVGVTGLVLWLANAKKAKGEGAEKANGTENLNGAGKADGTGKTNGTSPAEESKEVNWEDLKFTFTFNGMLNKPLGGSFDEKKFKAAFIKAVKEKKEIDKTPVILFPLMMLPGADQSIKQNFINFVNETLETEHKVDLLNEDKFNDNKNEIYKLFTDLAEKDSEKFEKLVNSWTAA